MQVYMLDGGDSVKWGNGKNVIKLGLVLNDDVCIFTGFNYSYVGYPLLIFSEDTRLLVFNCY